jgi:dTDP-4-dehydrorhamnose 3,5-epimerase
MKEHATSIPGLRLFELPIYRDERGFFMERFREDRWKEKGFAENFVQENHSRSQPRVLRGLHSQMDPAQSKLVSVIRGRVFDVAVDLRKASPTFGQWYSVELSDANGLVLWVPYGFAHGFCVLGDEPADVIYKVDGFYNPKTEIGLRWNCPKVGVKWPIKDPILSPKDAVLPGIEALKPL